jgi:isopentenyl phosphate kinase
MNFFHSHPGRSNEHSDLYFIMGSIQTGQEVPSISLSMRMVRAERIEVLAMRVVQGFGRRDLCPLLHGSVPTKPYSIVEATNN